MNNQRVGFINNANESAEPLPNKPITAIDKGDHYEVDINKKEVKTWIGWIAANWKTIAAILGIAVATNGDRIYTKLPNILPYIVKCECNCCKDTNDQPTKTDEPTAVQPIIKVKSNK